MAATKPTVVLTQGGFHALSAYDALGKNLNELGYEFIGVNIPSIGSKDPAAESLAKDSSLVREKVSELIEAGKDVLIVGHSYGGITGGAAAFDFSKTTQNERGAMAGVLGLVYVSAMILPEGESFHSYLGGFDAPSIVDATPEGMCIEGNPKVTFYHDIPDAEAEARGAALLPQSRQVFATPAPPTAWAQPAFDGRRFYLRCMDDQALPAPNQDFLVQRSGVAWNVLDLPSSHSPFASMPLKLAEMIDGIVRDLQRL